VASFTGKPFTASVTASCTKDTLTMASPRATFFTGAVPDLGYWPTLRCIALRYSKALSSPMSCTRVAMAVYAVPEEAGLAIWISPLYSGFARSDQQAGAFAFFRASSSVL